jgi:hypothetical protein
MREPKFLRRLDKTNKNTNNQKMSLFGFEPVDVVVGLGVFWGMTSFWPDDDGKKEVEAGRMVRQVRQSSGGDPRVINKLKYDLISYGVEPIEISSDDPVETEAALRRQVESLTMANLHSPSENITQHRSPNAPGNLVIDYLNLGRHRDQLLPASEPDGE